jgi:phospholipase C
VPLAALALAGCSGGSTSIGAGMPTPGRSSPPGGPSGPFAHVVVVVQENRTVDNLFNGFPGADTVRSGEYKHTVIPLVPVPLEPSAGQSHSYRAFIADYDNGAMDGFFRQPPETAYAYVRQTDVANYWTLASRFTLADETFQMNMGPSFAAHVNLVAGQGGYPMAFAGNPHGNAPGCFGSGDVIVVDMRDGFPAPERKGLDCQDMPTIFDVLDQAGVSWKYYAPASGIGLTYWSAPDYIRHIALGPDHANLVNPETRVLDDIAHGTLPAVAYVAPQACTSDHPHGSTRNPLAGPKWVAAITNAIGASAYWKNTLVLVTWDDWGGWYDHVPPPLLSADQLGFRVPLLIVSAYAKSPGSVDHRVRSQASILSAIEQVFRLGSLGQLDAKSDDLGSDFDFGHGAAAYGEPLPSATSPPDANCPIPPDQAG